MEDHFIPVGAPVHRRRLSRLQTALAARRNVLELIPALSYRQAIVSGEMLMRWHMLADPGGMKRVMLDNLSNYPKSEIMRRMLRPAIGDSLFNADGADWKWQRRAVVPVFTHRNVLALAPAMTRTAGRVCERLRACGGRAEMVGEMLTATFDVICDVALSGREHFDGHTFGAAITDYFRTAGRASLLDFLGFPQWFPRPGELVAGRSVKTMHEMVGAAIEARRRQAGAPADDLLAHMLEARDPETGQRMSPQELIFNMQFFIVAGHETTALALAWALYLLANSPVEQDKARSQARGVLQARNAGPDDLAALPFIRQVLEEAMRLYPPVPFMSREARSRDQIGEVTVAAGTRIIIAPWVLHRHRKLWPDADMFAPERFAPQNRGRIPRFAYLPFGAGPRICVGATFAMQEALLALTMIARRFRLTLAEGAEVMPFARMTLRPMHGLPMRVEKRNGAP